MKVLRVRKDGHYHHSIKITVIFAIKPRDPALPPHVRGSLEHPRHWIRYLHAVGTTTNIFRNFCDYVCTYIETNNIPGTDFHRVFLWDNLLKRHTHLLPTTSRSHLDVHPATGNNILQTPHDVRVALHCSVAGSIDGCLCGDVGDKLELGAGVDILKLSEGVVVEIVLDVIKKERATALPL